MTLAVPATSVSVYSMLVWGITEQIAGFGRSTHFIRTDGTNLGFTESLHEAVGIPGLPYGDSLAFDVNDPGSIGGTITYSNPNGLPGGSLVACLVDFGIPFVSAFTTSNTQNGVAVFTLPTLASPFLPSGTWDPPTLGIVTLAKGGGADVLASDTVHWDTAVNVFSAFGPQTTRQFIFDCGDQTTLWNSGTNSSPGPSFVDQSGGRPMVGACIRFFPTTELPPPPPVVRGRAFAQLIGD